MKERNDPTYNFLVALEENDVEGMKKAIDEGAVVEPDDIIDVVKQNQLEIVKYIYENRAVDNTEFKDGCLPIHWASTCGCKEIIEYFIQKNPKMINKQSASGQTPLHYAVTSKQPDMDLIQFLLNNGANIEIQNVDGKSPLDLALEEAPKKGEITDYEIFTMILNKLDKFNLEKNLELLKLLHSMACKDYENLYYDNFSKAPKVFMEIESYLSELGSIIEEDSSSHQ